MNKPPPKMSEAIVTAGELKVMAKSKSLMNTKATKNLQFAKDLNKEMEQMFADESYQVKPSKKSKKSGKLQRQVKFGDGQASEMISPSSVSYSLGLLP
jgi:hypothetical protein